MKRISNLFTPENLTNELCRKFIENAAVEKSNRQEVYEILNCTTFKPEEKLREYLLMEDITKIPLHDYKYTQRNDNGKLRNICIPTFWPDQCIHHALIDVAKDKFIKRIDPYACSSIEDRGQIYGVHALKKWIQQYDPHMTKYFLKIDIKKCFESLTPEVILNKMHDVIKDYQWLGVLEAVLYRAPTLPIGLYLSAWLLNIILKPADDYIRSQSFVTFYIRYMDDMVIFSPNRRKLKVFYNTLQRFFYETYRLFIKPDYILERLNAPNESILGRIKYVDMLGYRVGRKTVMLRAKNHRKLRKISLRIADKRNHGIKISKQQLQSFLARAGSITNKIGIPRNIQNRKYLKGANIMECKNDLSKIAMAEIEISKQTELEKERNKEKNKELLKNGSDKLSKRRQMKLNKEIDHKNKLIDGVIKGKARAERQIGMTENEKLFDDILHGYRKEYKYKSLSKEKKAIFMEALRMRKKNRPNPIKSKSRLKDKKYSQFLHGTSNKKNNIEKCKFITLTKVATIDPEKFAAQMPPDIIEQVNRNMAQLQTSNTLYTPVNYANFGPMTPREYMKGLSDLNSFQLEKLVAVAGKPVYCPKYFPIYFYDKSIPAHQPVELYNQIMALNQQYYGPVPKYDFPPVPPHLDNGQTVNPFKMFPKN